MKRMIPTIAIAFVLMFGSSSVLAGVEEVRVHVEGMACPFCAHNIEKRLKTLEGVRDEAPFNVSVDKGLATLTWRPDARFDPSAVREQIRRAGFTPGEIAVTAEGVIEIKDSDGDSPLRLVMESTNENIPLRRADRKDHQRSYQALRQYISNHKEDDAKNTVRVRGAVTSDGSTWSLTLHRWAPTQFGKAVILNVKDMVCENCSTRAMRTINEMAGVIHVEADHEIDRIWIWTESKQPDIESFKTKIRELGFDVMHEHKDTSDDTK